MKRLVMAAVAVSAILGGSGYLSADKANADDDDDHGPPPSVCTFKTVGANWRLQSDCAPTSAVMVPDGLRLDGRGHTMFFIGSSWNGPLVTNAGDEATVHDLRIDATGVTSASTCAITAILFHNAAGNIRDNRILLPPTPGTCEVLGIGATSSGGTYRVDVTRNTITNVSGNAIEVRDNIDSNIARNSMTAVPGADDGNFAIALVGPGLKRAHYNISHGLGGGVAVVSTVNAEVSGNEFHEANIGVSIFSINGIAVTGTTVRGNYIEAQTLGVAVFTPSAAGGTISDTTIRANEMHRVNSGFTPDPGLPERGILAETFTGVGTIDVLLVKGNTVQGWATAIDIADATNVTEANNTVLP